MLEFIILGQVPGTNYRLSYLTMLLVLLGILLTIEAAMLLVKKQKQAKQTPATD